MAKKEKEKVSVHLPKAWQSVKHTNESSQLKTNLNDTWSAIGTIILVLFILFILLGGVSQTGVIKFIFNWSHNVGEAVSNWIEGGSIVQNEDGIYWDPSGQSGDKIGGDDSSNDSKDSKDEKKETEKDTNNKSKNSEVKNE